MRDLHPFFAAAVAQNAVAPAILVYLDFEGQPLRVWSGVGPLSHDGHLWLGIGTLGGVDPVEEYSEVRAGTINLTLTHIPSETLSTVKDLIFKRRAAEIHLALFTLTDNPTLIGTDLLLRGTIDTLQLNRDTASSTIRVTIANELSRLRDSWGALYTDPHQRALHPDDTGLRFIANMQDLNIRI